MSYVLKSNIRPKGIIPVPLKIVIAIVAVLVLLNFFSPGTLPAFFTTLVRPFWNVEQGFLHGKSSREELQTILSTSLGTSLQNSVLSQENEHLKNLLGRSIATHPLLATIYKRPPFSAYDTLILDVGSGDGVALGDKVYALGNIPVGEIAEVYGGSSKVKLYSSSGEKFTILIGSTTIEAQAIGKGGGHFEASLPRDTKIQIGEQVLIPTLSDAFIGKVEGIASEPSEPFSKVLFAQPVNLYEMRWVIVDVKNDVTK